MQNEVWKKIPYSNEYEISNLGGFRHLYINRYDINTKKIIKISKITYPKLQKRSGYYCFRIYENHVNFKTYNLHRVIANLFIPNPNNYPCINHKNENKLDNRVDNLEWCTYSYNSTYSRGKPIKQYDNQNNFIKEWKSINEAKKETKINNIEKCLKGKYKTAGGFIWKYVKE